MDPSAGDGIGQSATTVESVDQPKETADSIPGSSHELKEDVPDASNVETSAGSMQTSIPVAAQEPETSNVVEEGLIEERVDGHKLHAPGVTSTLDSSAQEPETTNVVEEGLIKERIDGDKLHAPGVTSTVDSSAQEAEMSNVVEEGLIKERVDGDKLHAPGVTSTVDSSGTSLPPIEIASIDKNNAATETTDTCDKAVEVHDSCEQMKETGDGNKGVPGDQVNVSPQERSEKKLDDSGDAVGKSSSSDYLVNFTRESENFHDNTEKTNCGSPTVISSTEQPVIAFNGSSKQDIPPTVNKEEPKVPSVVVDPENTEASTEGRSFTFHVPSSIEFSDVQAPMKWLSSPTGNGSKESPVMKIVEGSPSSSGLVSVKAQVPAHDSPGSVQTTGRKTGGGRAKAVSERKKRRTSVKGGVKGGTEMGNTLKDQDLLRRPEIGGKSGLNDSALLTASKQPFTEMQQVQLRAQILVYGSLISKLIPEEVHMMSAFGGSDGGRSIWDIAWRAYREKISRQTLNAMETEESKANSNR